MADIGFNVDQAVQHVGDYWEQDGLPTLVLAVLCLVGGSLAIWMPHYHSFRRDLPISGFEILIYGALFYFVARKNSPVVRWLKARITYPRTGYVALPPFGSVAAERVKAQDFKRHPEIWVIFPLCFSGVVGTPWFGAGIIILATSIIWGVTRGRFPFSGILIPGLYVSAILFPLLSVESANCLPYFFITLGVLYVPVGIIQLVTYLRQHPVAQA